MSAARRLAELVERLGALTRAWQREAAAESGLQPVHLAALGYLARANRYSDTPAAAGEYLGVTKGTASQTLLVLERKGLLVKRPDASDGRVVHLELTPPGRIAAEDWAAPGELLRAFESLDAGRAEAAAEALTAALAALQRANGSRSFGVCRTCRFFRRRRASFECGLTGEPLSEADSAKICREHEPAAA